MNILLVNLNWENLVSGKTLKLHLTVPPLDLIYLENFARAAGHSAVIHDGFTADRRELAEHVRKADCIYITTTPFHMWQCPNCDWESIRSAIGYFPKEKTVLGGLHPSVFPEIALQETGVHAVIRREPESAFLSFLQCGSWREAAGVSWQQDGAVHHNPTGQPLPMDQLVVQDYRVNPADYGYFLLGPKTALFESSRGCPWKCNFCDQEMFHWGYRTKSPEVFAEEVARTLRNYPFETAYFFDLEFTIQNGRTEQIAQELIKRDLHKKLRWAIQTRADMVNESILEALRDAGCRLIHFGVESGDPEILKSTNKKITLEKIERGVALTKRYGLQTACFFMFGLPTEKPEQFSTTLEFARELNPTYASFHFAVPFPGTPLYRQYLSEFDEPWGSWPSFYFKEWDASRIARYLKWAFVKFYLIPRRFELRVFRDRLSNLGHKLSYFGSILKA